MKVIERDIFPYQQNDFLSPIRNKIDYARLLVYSSRQLLLNDETKGYDSIAKLKVVIDKMSRLFIYQKHSYFSVAFPFTILTDTENNVININTYSGNKLDNLTISSVISILNNESFTNNPSLFQFPFDPSNLEYNGVMMLEEIFQFEPSYIRYDHDSKNLKGKHHPLDHLDINYSQCGT